MKKYLPLIFIFGVLAALISVFTLSSLVQKKESTDIRLKAAPTTALSFEPGGGSYFVGQVFDVNVKVSSGTNQIVSSDIVIDYTPSVLEITDILAGTFLDGANQVQKSIDKAAGRAILSFYTAKTNAQSGDGTLAKISFKAKAVGSASVVFGSQTVLGALGENSQNVLTMKTDASYQVVDDTAPPSPISDLSAPSVGLTSITLTWKAPSDQGQEGKAASYELRYSTLPISENTWSSGTLFTGLSAPLGANSQENTVVSSLASNTQYYFAIKSNDAKGNASLLSNVALAKTTGNSPVSFKFKLLGVYSQKPNRSIKLVLKQSGVVKYTFTVSAVSDGSGIYSGTTAEAEPGLYDVFIKDPTHLQKKFASVNLNSGSSLFDWSGTPLLPGDIDGSDFINAVDLAAVINDYFPNTPANSLADINMDGTVNAIDIGSVIENYFKEGDK